jgi:ribonuclease HI/DNA polymerase-3 subunit epsilon
MNCIIAYTDGSAVVTGEKLGGYGIYIIDGEKEEMYSKGFKNTTTGRMELMAMLACLRRLEDKSRKVIIYCDSMYVVNTINKWIFSWQRKSWIGVKNVDILIQIYEELLKFKKNKNYPDVRHIKGHTKNEDIHSLGNAIVDRLASYKRFKTYEIDQL